MYAVIFKAQIRDLDQTYHETVKRMRDLATQQYGCREFLSLSEGDQEISISYWDSLSQIQQWKQNTEHLQAQTAGKEKWYRKYHVDIVEIVRQYGYPE